jgi:hypothetical protein
MATAAVAASIAAISIALTVTPVVTAAVVTACVDGLLFVLLLDVAGSLLEERFDFVDSSHCGRWY